MKRVFCFLSVLILFVLWSSAQPSKVSDNLSIPSKILKSERKYAIYLPPGYETSQRSYPVLYLLHGASDNQTAWVQFGEVQRITDKAIEDGTATAMIIVMPDANTGKMGYFNDISGNWNYEHPGYRSRHGHALRGGDDERKRRLRTSHSRARYRHRK